MSDPESITDPPRREATLIAVDMVIEELFRATNKFPPFNSLHEGYAVILEEVDELWDEVRANRPREAMREATQVAAMALRFIADIGASLNENGEAGK